MTVQMVPPSPFAPPAALERTAAGSPSIVVLLAVSEADVRRYPTAAFTTRSVHTTADAIDAIQRIRPRVLTVDWDFERIDTRAVCEAAAQFASATMLVTTAAVERVPAAIKAGCQSVLMKPFGLNLVAARLGRLCREVSVVMSPAVRARVERGTNRTWPGTACPQCGAAGAISFDHSSHRRTWYACVGCDYVWLGPRQE